ncbi:Uncharacterised protein [Acinetobacter baumannii]|nr:Uncharacterised protein [Acinetobacter baumannii]
MGNPDNGNGSQGEGPDCAECTLDSAASGRETGTKARLILQSGRFLHSAGKPRSVKRKHALSAPYARNWQPARRPGLGRHGEFDEYDSAHHLPPVPALKRRRGCQGVAATCVDGRRTRSALSPPSWLSFGLRPMAQRITPARTVSGQLTR